MTKRIDKETMVTLKSVYNQLTKKAIQGQGEGWVSLAEFGLQLRKIGFDFSEYGYQQLFYFLTGTNVTSRNVTSGSTKKAKLSVRFASCLNYLISYRIG